MPRRRGVSLAGSGHVHATSPTRPPSRQSHCPRSRPPPPPPPRDPSHHIAPRSRPHPPQVGVCRGAAVLAFVPAGGCAVHVHVYDAARGEWPAAPAPTSPWCGGGGGGPVAVQLADVSGDGCDESPTTSSSRTACGSTVHVGAAAEYSWARGPPAGEALPVCAAGRGVFSAHGVRDVQVRARVRAWRYAFPHTHPMRIMDASSARRAPGGMHSRMRSYAFPNSLPKQLADTRMRPLPAGAAAAGGGPGGTLR